MKERKKKQILQRKLQRKLQYHSAQYFLSIRRFLTLSLIGILTLIIMVIAGLNYWQLSLQDQYIVQTQLVDAARVLEGLSYIDIQARSSEDIKNLLKGASHANYVMNYKNNAFVRHYPTTENQLTFQVWDRKQQHLLIKSDNAPTLPMGLNYDDGFHSYSYNHTQWQMFILDNTNHDLRIIVTLDSNYLHNLDRVLFLHNLGILLIVYIGMIILLLAIIEFGLRSLKKVATDVSQREPDNLHPISSNQVPIEIRPLIKELNKLFLKVRDTLEREKHFTADAAHELRTPLAALKTQVEVALREKDEQLRTTILRNILKGVNRCTHVVDQLLTLNRLEPQAPLSSPEMINLSHLTADMIAELAPFAIEKDIEISLHAPEKPVYIKGNSTSIIILLRNLIDNAIIYTPSHGQVSITIFTNQIGPCLQVIDTGPGIPDHLRKRIFERFFRELGNKADGSGLGLSIVQQIVRLHQAQIQAKLPADGHGLEMLVQFPKITLPPTHSQTGEGIKRQV